MIITFNNFSISLSLRTLFFWTSWKMDLSLTLSRTLSSSISTHFLGDSFWFIITVGGEESRSRLLPLFEVAEVSFNSGDEEVIEVLINIGDFLDGL